MKVAIMQPYFFPYLGYFSLIKQTDYFILFDPVQFIRHGWIERNRVLKPGGGWQYIRVPLKKHTRNTIIKDIRIANDTNWRTCLFRQLAHYKKIAPYYSSIIDLLKDALDFRTDSIVKLNERIIKTVCTFLGINIRLSVLTEMNLDFKKPEVPDEWALKICVSLGNITEYWNPQGGIEFFDRRKYQEAGIDIKFLKLNFLKYYQGNKQFEPDLSIIDALMFVKPETIITMLDDFIIL